MALTKEQAINLINQNEDTTKRWDFIVDVTNESLLEWIEKRRDKEPEGYWRSLQEIDRRIESCDFPDIIAKEVYLALLNREEIEYLRTL